MSRSIKPLACCHWLADKLTLMVYIVCGLALSVSPMYGSSLWSTMISVLVVAGMIAAIGIVVMLWLRWLHHHYAGCIFRLSYFGAIKVEVELDD